MILAILFLTFLITLSTLVRTSPHAFLIFIMPIAVLSAAGVSYLQSPVFAVASIFGPRAVQAVMAGQAAVSVVVNLVQLVGAALSLRSRRETSVQRGRTPEEISAFVSLAFTMGFLFVSFVAHGWLIRTPVYVRLIAPLERRLLAANAPGTEALLASTDMARSVGTRTRSRDGDRKDGQSGQEKHRLRNRRRICVRRYTRASSVRLIFANLVLLCG
jgi:hypothetical protein